jgi:putative membrane protein
MTHSVIRRTTESQSSSPQLLRSSNSERDGSSSNSERHVAAGIAAGFIGGIVGSWTMNRFLAAWSKLADNYESQSAGGSEDAREWQERAEGQNATEIAAQAVAEPTLGRPLTEDELKIAAPALHYLFGATVGAIYGGLAELSRDPGAVHGAGFGTAVWLGADEIAMPMLGLSDPDAEYPLELHAQSFFAHLVFGLTTEAVRRGVRVALAGDRKNGRRERPE